MKLIIVILSSILLSSCAPVEALEKLPELGKMVVIISICFFLAFIFGHPELQFDLTKSNDYESYEQKLINKLKSVYWLLIIIIILLIIILYKIW